MIDVGQGGARFLPHVSDDFFAAMGAHRCTHLSYNKRPLHNYKTFKYTTIRTVIPETLLSGIHLLPNFNVF